MRSCLKQTFIYCPYPYSEKLEVLLRDYKDGNHDLELKEFISLWFTEGVPLAFRNCPWLYKG